MIGSLNVLCLLVSVMWLFVCGSVLLMIFRLVWKL